MEREISASLVLLLCGCLTLHASGMQHKRLTSAGDGDTRIIYVNGDAEAGGDGRSWNTALKSLQEAIDRSGSDTEIWVAKGMYFPERKVGGRKDRHKSFQLKNKLILRGGFAGDESMLEERDWKLNRTVLSGDLNSNDSEEGNMNDNSFHVVSGNGTDSTAVLDGFVISGGNADRKKWPDDGGGGMNNHIGSPSVINCVFEKNHCFADGGGMRNWGECSPRIIGCTFVENRSEQEGAGMMNGPDSSPLVLNCVFSNNYSAEDGGGMYNNETKEHLVINCLFHHNTAALTGGGIYHVNNSQTHVVNCTLTENKALKAGGGVSNRDSNPVLVNCILWRNEAPESSEINNLRSVPDVSFSNVSGGYIGPNNMDENPVFSERNFELSENSPCIDRGTNEALPAHVRLDLNQEARIVNALVDLGAFEYNKD